MTEPDKPQNDATPGGDKPESTGAASKTPAKKPARAKKRSFSGPKRLIQLAILLGLAWLAWPLWGPILPLTMQAVLSPIMEAGRTSPLAADVAGLKERMTTLEKSVGEMRAQIAKMTPSETSVAQAQKLSELETGLDTLREGLANRALASSTQAFAEKLRKLETDFGALNEALAALAEGGKKISALEIRMDTLEKRMQSIPAEGGTPAPVAEVDSKTLARISTLEAENKTLSQTISALESRPAPAPAGAVSGTDKGAMLMMAIGQLRRAARGDGSWATQWEAVGLLADRNPSTATGFAALQRYAKTGVPSLETLRQSFPPVADAIIRANVEPAGEGWFDRTWRRVSGLITIRRTGAAAAETPGVMGTVARAELALKNNDAAGAVKALSSLEGAPAAAAKDWLEKAEARASVDHALGLLEAGAISPDTGLPNR